MGQGHIENESWDLGDVVVVIINQRDGRPTDVALKKEGLLKVVKCKQYKKMDLIQETSH